MKKNTISISQLTYQILFEQRVCKLVETVTSTAQSVQSTLAKLGDDINNAGMKMSDDNVQAAVLDQLIDAGGKVGKVDISDVEKLDQQVQEHAGYIQEGGGAVATITHTIGDVLGNSALVEFLSHAVAKILGKKDTEVKGSLKKVQSFFKNLSALTGLPGKAVEKAFKWIAAKWGAGEKGQKIFGIAGTILFVIGMGIIGVLAFPSLTSVTAITLGLAALVGKTIEVVKLLGHMIHVFKDHEKEAENMKDDRTKLQKNIDQWLEAPISGPSSEMGDMARNMSAMR
jgi:hypothetical protein